MSQAAVRYAKSLVEIAQEQNALDQVHEDMLLFNNVCAGSRDLELLLKNPIINHDKKLDVLNSIFGGKVHAVTSAIFNIITRKNREAILREISVDFHRQYNLIKNIKRATVESAVALTDAQRAEFSKVVAEATNNSVELVEKVDEELIGGFVLTVDDRQIDSSVKTKLRNIKKSFSDQTYISKI